jgi:hypothetical protein
MGGVLQGVSSGMVRAKFGIEVAQDSDADRVAHASIVLDEDGHFVGCGSGQVRSVVRLLPQKEAAHGPVSRFCDSEKRFGRIRH